MKRAYYSASISQFMSHSLNEILSELTNNNSFSTDGLQKNAWKREITIPKAALVNFIGAHLILEYTIPRIGSRADAILLYRGIIFLIEFKVGRDDCPQYAIEQVTDYALDLNCFHKESHDQNVHGAPL